MSARRHHDDRSAAAGGRGWSRGRRRRAPAAALAIAVALTALASATVVAAPRDRGRRPVALLVLAHPDDETMIGGLLGRFRERGFRVVIVPITNGEGGKLVTGISAAGELIERAPGEPGTGRVRTREDLAALRQREHLRAGRVNGVDQVTFLSSRAHPAYRDDHDDGVASWDVPRLTARLAQIARRVGPDVVITLNPDESGAHPQHTGAGGIVRALHATGGFDVGGRRPSLYGIREHDWLHASAIPQDGDVSLPRTESSPVLGVTYGDFLRRGSAQYPSQPPFPRAIAARSRSGLVPGLQRSDLLRRLDRGPGPGLEALLAAHPPLAHQRALTQRPPRVRRPHEPRPGRGAARRPSRPARSH